MNLISLLAEKPIAYHRPLIRKFGIVPGIFLGQLLYWQGRGSKGEWVYKTQAEMKEETCLSRQNQETARKKLIEAGVLEEKLAGIPAQLHFRVNLAKLAECLAISSLRETSKLDCEKPANSDAGNQQSITENTQETTTKREHAPPAIEMIRELTKRYPAKALWPDLIKVLGGFPLRDKLQRCFTAWIMRGYNPMNFSWVTEWYVKGIPVGGNHLPTQAEMNAGGRGKLVI